MQRRTFLTGALATAAVLARGNVRATGAESQPLPRVGLGSWITFNVGADPVARDNVTDVLRAFFADGGQLVDSSPMYGSSQQVIGHSLGQLGSPKALYAADKVWISPGTRGPGQIEESRRRWGIPAFDLLQVHNLLAWQEHLVTLRTMQAAGQLRHVGVTTSEGRRHDEIERILQSEKLDFVQLSYNLLDREAEQRIFPLALERKVSVIVNRPFRQGALLQQLQRHPLPPFAAELAATSWAQLALKFVISHPAVTCAIPATANVAHVRENLAAGHGPLPDDTLRRRLVQYVEAL
jgi:diketogulonate reductase-like aldo/keto reductase